jgi:hypothetical protein
VPFVFVTGFAATAVPAGFEDRPLIQKPHKREQLLDLMRAIFKR